MKPYPKPEPKEKKKMKPIRFRSKRRASMEQIYATKTRPDFLKDNPFCQVRIEGCTSLATTVHHKKGRTEELLNDKRYFLAACMNCHDYIENNPEWAKEKGHSINRLAR